MRYASFFLILALVGCDAVEGPRPPGALDIFLSTTTAELPYFNFGVSIDSGTARPATSAERGAFRVGGLAAGDHLVELTGLPANCSSGADRKRVSIAGGDTVTVGFDIKCRRTTGDLAVTVVTTGHELDPDGYSIRVDNVGNGTIGTNGSMTVPQLVAGDRSVQLTGVASNCTVSGTTTRFVTITAGRMATLTFTVSCVATTGIIRFVSTTTGVDLDPDGVQVLINQLPGLRIPAGTAFLRVTIGTHQVRIRDVDPNCTLAGAADRSITVPPADTVVVTVNVSCVELPEGTLAFSVADPALDTLAVSSTTLPPAPDLVAMNGKYAPGFLILTFRFSSPVAITGSNAVYGYVDFDTDENAHTGDDAIASAFGGTGNHGADYLISMFTAANATVYAATSFATSSVIRRAAGDSLTLYIPLAKLGGDDGNMTITAVFGTADRPTDVAPNAGVIIARIPGAAIAPTAPSTGAVIAPRKPVARPWGAGVTPTIVRGTR